MQKKYINASLGQVKTKVPCIRKMHTYVCCTWQPEMTPSPPAHTMVFRAMLPHQSGWEQTECSTTGMAATWRMSGTLPTSVKGVSLGFFFFNWSYRNAVHGTYITACA